MYILKSNNCIMMYMDKESSPYVPCFVQTNTACVPHIVKSIWTKTQKERSLDLNSTLV